jgi:hypothetical protein
MDIQFNTYFNKVSTIKIRSGFSFQGIVVGIGTKWILINYIPADYVTDGFAFVSRNYISKIDISEDDTFTESILKLRKCNFNPIESFNLDDTEDLLRAIQKTDNLIGIKLKNPQSQYIGHVNLLREKSMKVHLIDKWGNWLTEETFLYNELRAIYTENDYLKALELYISSKQLH